MKVNKSLSQFFFHFFFHFFRNLWMFGCRNTDRCCIRVIILVVIYDLMSKLKSTCFLNDLKSKVKVINKVKVIKKMKIARNWLKRVENRKSHFQNFLINWTFFCGLSHYIAEHWYRGTLYLLASRYLLTQTWGKKTHAVVTL